ncbi:MAG: OB-fold nucleic acid binding domain-containing protein, partial [Sphingomonadales bacterium]
MHEYRSHDCGKLRESDVGATVRLSGWVHRKRDHGNLLFLDLRDHYGITQCVVDVDGSDFKSVEAVRAESVVRIDGHVVKRSDDTVNPDIPTGHVEVVIDSFEVLSGAEELPLPVFGDQEYPEDIRLKYRFLDLRRERMHANIVLRSHIISS